MKILAKMALLALLACNSSYAEDKDDDDRDVEWAYLKGASLEYDVNYQGIDVQPEGYKAQLSLSFGDHIFGVLERSSTDNDALGVSYDFETEGYGFGYHWTSWFVSYTYNNWELNNFDFDVDTLRVGFRDKWSDRFEFNASYSWNDIDGAENEDGYQIGIAYELWDDFNVTADWETIGGLLDLDGFSLGLRLDF